MKKHTEVTPRSMAQQPLQNETTKWKVGLKYDFYDRDTRKWVEAEVIKSFSDDKGEWIKVRCGGKDINVLNGDPDLRKRSVIPGHQLKQLQDAATQLPNIAPILESILPSSGQGLYSHSDGRCTYIYIILTLRHDAVHTLYDLKLNRTNDVVQSGELRQHRIVSCFVCRTEELHQ